MEICVFPLFCYAHLFLPAHQSLFSIFHPLTSSSSICTSPQQLHLCDQVWIHLLLARLNQNGCRLKSRSFPPNKSISDVQRENYVTKGTSCGWTDIKKKTCPRADAHLYACQLPTMLSLEAPSGFVVVLFNKSVMIQMQTNRVVVFDCVLVLGRKMAEMGQKTDGGFGILAGFLEEMRQSWCVSKAGRKQTG